jgi:hypothetical protein
MLVWYYDIKAYLDRTVSRKENKTDRHDITETLLKVALNSIKQTSIKY